MFSSQITSGLASPAVLRVFEILSLAVSKSLMVAGAIFVLGLAGTYQGHSGFIDGVRAMFPATAQADETGAGTPMGAHTDVLDTADSAAADEGQRLLPSMRQALASVAKRYRVSNEVLVPIFLAAQDSGRELGLDPLLIIAVIGVESGFNPFSQSVVGAQGLMQVMPRFHSDKLPEDAGALPFFDPITNVQIGARILRESIARNGGLVPGLQQFGGAINDVEQRYSSKVMLERQRLEAAVQPLKRRA
ncbi:transglycosylase SLT domain-containing protein [Azonexus sp.]|uniref:transglycosylase SLT domain-containing protein n=1 Tax=Azonexus sp. TaxID=1872668 RepID=UPI0039E4FBD5